MTTTRKQYMELYVIAMEEARHHERIYTQTWIAALTAMSVLGGLSYFIWQYFFAPAVTPFFRQVMTGLAFLFVLSFLWSLARHSVDQDECRKITNKIERMWEGKTKVTVDFGDLLVVQKIKKIWGPRYKQVYSPFTKKLWLWVYFGPPLGLWLYLWWWAL